MLTEGVLQHDLIQHLLLLGPVGSDVRRDRRRVDVTHGCPCHLLAGAVVTQQLRKAPGRLTPPTKSLVVELKGSRAADVCFVSRLL